MARSSKRKGPATKKKEKVKAGPIRKFRAWMDLGRAQGISTTASIAMIGALTSTAPIRFFDLASPSSFDLIDIIGIIIISIFAHMVPNCYIELGDLPLDSRIKESSMKPVVSGVIKKKEVVWFVRSGLIASWISCFIFFPTLEAMIFLALSALWVMWYGNGLGKRIAGSYDYAFSLAYSFFTLFGVYSVGEPTIYTWFFIGIVITGGTAFAQWENGLKDVDADRAAGVRSFAVLSGVKAKKKMSPGHPYMVYGYAIKIVMLLCCFLALFEMYRTEVMLGGPAVELVGLDGIMPIAYPYLIFLVLIGIGTQVLLMRRFLRDRTRIGIRKTILMDVPMTALVGFSVIIGMVHFMTLFLVLVFLIGGYFVGSALQYGTEFKFGRYAREYDERMERELKGLKKAKARK